MADFLYIHIPFCVRKCIYCDFFSVPYDVELEKRYIACLCSELLLRRDSIGMLKAVYIGGGTPSLLTHGSLEMLFGCIRENFSASSGAEITIEANPGTIDRPKLELLSSLGVNRISIGVQSLHDDELKLLGRIHNSRNAADAIKAAKSAGFHNVSLDLMYGIPGQTIEAWADTLERIIHLHPEHISAYELTPEKKTPLFGFIEADALRIPSEDLVIDMYDFAIERLSSAGYSHYEISNFALPGFECVHNLNYWDRGEYLGAGAGAHSFLHDKRWYNSSDLTEYIACRGKVMKPDPEYVSRGSDAAKEFLFLGLRKTEGLQLERLATMGFEFPEACGDLIEQGYLIKDDTHLRLTRKGMLVSNSVIVRIFECLSL